MRDIKKGSQRYGRDDNRDFGRYSEPKQMHPATCSECKASCEVPFKPTEGKPVFCRDCFRKKRDSFDNKRDRF